MGFSPLPQFCVRAIDPFSKLGDIIAYNHGSKLLKKLNLNLGAETFTEAGGEGRIWLDNVQCVGTETKLINCTASSIGVHSCTHDQDAGVRCCAGT